jgi:4-amino-4-deoxy-L-arabinose transferase-like glycosyltransferase
MRFEAQASGDASAIRAETIAPRARAHLASAIEHHPQRAFALFCALHALVWTALPSVLYANLPLDLIEALTYGREWQIGYDKLPPLPWWMVEAVHRSIGIDAAYYALAQLAVIGAFALVWSTARPLVGEFGALVAILIIDALHYFHFTAVKFNHDVIQLPLWALAGYSFHAALKGGRLLHWLLLGLAIGLALWAKYFVVVLALPLALFLLFDRGARKHLATPGPWIAVAVALVVMAPHLVWLWNSDFLPFAYAQKRAAPSRGIVDHFIHPFVFALGQLVFLLPSLLIAAMLVWPRKSAPDLPAARTKGGAVPAKDKRGSAADAFDRRMVTLLAFGPAATVIALSTLSGRGAIAMWGYPLWLFLGLWIVLRAATAIDAARFLRIAAAWSAMFAIYAFVFIANYSFLPLIDQRYRAPFFPGDRLADELARGFRAATGHPLAYVIGTMWEGGNVGHYAREQPRVLIDGDPRRAPWIDLGDLRSKGAVVVWTCAENSKNKCHIDTTVIPLPFRAIGADAQVQPPFALPFRHGDMVLIVGWAILRPSPTFSMQHGKDIGLYSRL